MQYMARVEIHHADRETYERLHSAMEAESFTRFLIGARDGKKYHMPIGTYWTESSNGAEAAIESAKRAALPIDAKAEITVSGAGQIIFFNCPEVVSVLPYANLGLFAAAHNPISKPFANLLALAPAAILRPPFRG
jgi:hypothetical protein